MEKVPELIFRVGPPLETFMGRGRLQSNAPTRALLILYLRSCSIKVLRLLRRQRKQEPDKFSPLTLELPTFRVTRDGGGYTSVISDSFIQSALFEEYALHVWDAVHLNHQNLSAASATATNAHFLHACVNCA